jgi:hypothetical protein
MFPQSHLLLPLFLGLVLQKLGHVDLWWTIVAVLVGVFIDADHPLMHLVRTGRWSIKETADDAFKDGVEDRSPLHEVPGMLVMSVLFIVAFAFQLYWASAVAVGYYTHMLLDHLSADGRLLAHRTTKDYYGDTKPMAVHVLGYTINLAKFEIVFDVLVIVGIIVVFFS